MSAYIFSQFSAQWFNSRAEYLAFQCLLLFYVVVVLVIVFITTYIAATVFYCHYYIIVVAVAGPPQVCFHYRSSSSPLSCGDDNGNENDDVNNMLTFSHRSLWSSGGSTWRTSMHGVPSSLAPLTPSSPAPNALPAAWPCCCPTWPWMSCGTADSQNRWADMPGNLHCWWFQSMDELVIWVAYGFSQWAG